MINIRIATYYFKLFESFVYIHRILYDSVSCAGSLQMPSISRKCEDDHHSSALGFSILRRFSFLKEGGRICIISWGCSPRIWDSKKGLRCTFKVVQDWASNTQTRLVNFACVLWTLLQRSFHAITVYLTLVDRIADAKIWNSFNPIRTAAIVHYAFKHMFIVSGTTLWIVALSFCAGEKHFVDAMCSKIRMGVSVGTLRSWMIRI